MSLNEEEEIKEIYARFGVAIAVQEVLRRELNGSAQRALGARGVVFFEQPQPQREEGLRPLRERRGSMCIRS